MKSIIVNIRKELDLYEKYNNEVNVELIDYLIEEAKVNDEVEVIINTKLDIKNIDKLIIEGLKNTSQDMKKIDKLYDVKQLILFAMGMLFLIFSTLTQPEIVKEVILIIGWVFVWEVMDIAINIDTKYRRRKKIIEKLINCKIKVNNK